MQTESVTKEPIAIIGLGCVLPDAPDVGTFWKNLLEGRDLVREVPPERWDPAIHWSEDKDAPDRTYAKIGAFVTDDAFDGLQYRLPPKVVEQIDPCQRWALAATRQAFLDAGYATGLRADQDQGRDFDRDRCAVIVGNAMGGELNKIATKRIHWADAAAALRADPDFQALPTGQQTAILERAEARYKDGTLPMTEDTMPGHLSNVVAGRIANAFDLGGKNFTTDAACASSLAALDAAVATLRQGEADLVVWGGTDRSMDVSPFVQFSKIGALSPDGSRPFDASANGFVMGEGCAMFLLKRLSDTERDGDHVYAVVRGIGGSSDGKGKGITAPNPDGQVKAVLRAYEDAEVDPATLGYLEAHGTSTPVGDPVELESAGKAFTRLTARPLAPGSIRVGSVKSNLGHLKSAAGAVGMLKAVLAVHHGRLPPSIHVTDLNPRIDWAQSPFRVQTTPEDWPEPTDHPRRAAVSSFGFGGTNFHVVLEGFVPGRLRKAEPAATTVGPTETELDVPAFQAHMADAAVLEGEAVVLTASDAPRAAALAAPAFAETGTDPRLRDLLHPLTQAGLAAGERVAFHVGDATEIPKKLALAQKAASDPASARLAFQQGVFLGRGTPQGKIAFLFPGQGTQYVNMGRDLAQKYAVVRNTFAEADEILFDELDGVRLTDILWPTPDTPENQARSEERLKLTEFTQPAVLAMDVALLRLLRQWGMEPDVVAGHSLGEYGALVAAGVLSFADALHAVAARGREMAHVEVPDLGKMASVGADWHTVSDAIAGVAESEYVICANKNCSNQTVIAGSSAGVDAAVERLRAEGLQAVYLPVSAAFHSEIVAPASEPLRKVLGRLDVQPPKVRVLSNVGAADYPSDPEAIRDNLAVQVASPVEWVEIIERMHAEDVRTFIEVGPKRALTGFVQDILKGHDDVRAVFANHPKKGDIQSLDELYAFLGASGFEPTLPALDDAAVYTAAFRDPTAAFQKPVVRAAPPAPAPAPIPAPTPIVQEDPRIQIIAKHLKALTAELRGTAPVQAAPAVAAAPSITVSGISVGLPGRHKPFFSPDNWDRILRGENLIDVLDTDTREAMARKHITRLVKSAGGQGTFESIDDPAQVIKLAGRRGDFDLREWGVDEELLEALDVTSQYAIAAGLEALHDAGLPLQRTYQETSTGGRLPKGWALPRSVGDETGIIFASAFPGYNALLDNLRAGVKDETFNRKFLFHVLSMGHSQLAQFLGARGPNTQVNAACASTTQAIAIAEDWIRAGRCKRVLVVGADDATSPNLMEWIGSGFLASGAATTKQDVTEAALPFDARRHGMIIGMGAVGLVVEAADEVEKRGMRPIARLLSTVVSNSAFHGSRLDVEHIAREMRKLVRRAGLDPAAIAPQTVFMSHETYTPARGGSAAAEIHALRETFGAAADRIVIANTKGFTGHPQGAGIEDAVALKCLQRGTVPPIPHLRQPDPALGTLNLSRGGAYDVRYALRLAAGFGSQVAMTLSELVAREDARVADAGRYGTWLGEVSGLSGARTEVVDRTLRIIDAAATTVTAPQPVARTVATPDADAVLPQVIALVADKTGYPVELLEPDLDMEADLGIDTVKQAELFAELRQTFGVPMSEDLSLKDYNTLRKVADYMAGEGPRSEPSPRTSEPSGGLVPDDALQQVTSLVAEKTGYPVELLEPDLDMEADLGIDTVKQAELFAELRETFGVPLDESLSLKDYNTLRKVAEYMAGGTAKEVSMPVSAPSAPAPANDDALQQVTALVADKTGYPVELLEPDLDMEADLGIDTVKQAELFGELRTRFGVPLNEELSLKDYNTLRKVADYMMKNQGAPAPVPTTEATVEGTVDTGIRRHVPSLRPAALPDEDNDLPVGPVLVVGDMDLAHLDAWKDAGFSPRATLDEEPVGILCLATEPGGDPLERAGALFDAAKAHPQLAFVATVTGQDGAHGLESPRDAGMAALAGLTKALRKELPEAVVKAIDLAPELDDATLAVTEVQRGGKRTEVCYGADGTRFVVDVAPAGLPDAVPDVAGKTLVVSGGAQGITAGLLAALAPQSPKLLLLGRTPLPEDAEAWATWTEADWKQAEADAIQGLKDAGQTPTPVAVQKVVLPMRKAAEAQRTLQRLTDAGAEVLYAAADVTDADTVTSVVRWARDRFGRIDGIVHAAGIEISKMLLDKPRDQFDTVFRIKVDGLRNLLAATREDDLSLLAGFGSVAGRFGNLGQTDYSAANDALAKAIVQAAHERGIETAFTVAWGPWGELGMATRGGIMTVLRESGVTPIPTAEGTAAFLRELATPGVRECVVAGGLGDLDTDGQIVPVAWDPALSEAEAWLRTAPESFRLLAGLDAFTTDRLTARVVLDRATDPYLFDHAVDGVPLLPGVFGLEAFAEAGRLLVPEDQVFLGATGVRFAAPLKQHKDEPVTAWVDAQATPDGDGGTRVACRLQSRFVGPDGKVHGEPRLHFEATLRFGPAPEPLTTAGVPTCDGTTRPDNLYPPFFHGPSFQVLAAAGPVTAEEATGAWKRPEAPCFAAGDAVFLSHPLVTEGLFQLCGLHTLQAEERMSLPAAIEALDVWSAEGVRDAVLWCRYNGRDGDGLRRFDAAACTGDGRVLVRLTGYGMVETGPAPGAGQAEDGKSGDKTRGEGPETHGEPTLADFDAPDEAIALPEVDGVVFAAVRVGDGPDSRGGLTSEEQETATAFPSRKRAAEWVAGRLAAKRAVMDVAPELSPTEITVENDGDGRPHLLVRGEPSPATLSLTHRDGWAIAALADGGLGIDLETVEPRSDAFWEEAFGAIERGHLRSQGDADLAAACAWAAKEACLKRQGTGLQTPLHDLHVRLDGPGAQVSGPFGTWGVRFYDIAGRVLAMTVPGFDPEPSVTVAAGAKA